MATAGRPMGKLHQDDVRTKIQASQLVNRLTDHALNGLELSQSQIKAIEILLRKSLPDLSAVVLSSDPENPVGITLIERRIVNASNPDPAGI